MDPVRIPEGNMAKLRQEFEKLGRRAEKLNLVPPKLVELQTVDIMFVSEKSAAEPVWVEAEADYIPKPTDDVHYRRYIVCVCEGEAPAIDGWKLVSVIDHTTDSEIGNLIRNVPGMETPIEYRKAEPICQHCNSKRRRQETFLLLKDGEYRQIGRNCLADFCRDPEMAANLVNSASQFDYAISLLSNAEEDSFLGGGGMYSMSYFAIEKVLTLTRQLIRNFGWMSRSATEIHGGTSTSTLVSGVLVSHDWKKYASREFFDAVNDEREEDVELAQNALQWIRSKRQSEEELNEYLYNLLVVCTQERIPVKHFGLACSLIPTFMREQEREVEMRLRKSRTANSKHFGEVKKREKFKLTCIGTTHMDGDFGVTTFVRFVDEHGNAATWRASGSINMIPEVTYLVTGTVKKHSVYNGVNQTELTRCKYERLELDKAPMDKQEEFVAA